MDKENIKKELKKIYEDVGGMVSSAAGLPGIESIPKKKKNRVIVDLNKVKK